MGNVEYEFCPHCGTRVQKDNSFCPVCGKDLQQKEKLKSKRPLGLSIFAIIWLIMGGMRLVLSVYTLAWFILLMSINWYLIVTIFDFLVGASFIRSFIGFWRGRSWSLKAFKITFVLTIFYLIAFAYDDIMYRGVLSDDIIIWVFFGILFIGTLYVLEKEETKQYLSKSR